MIRLRVKEKSFGFPLIPAHVPYKRYPSTTRPFWYSISPKTAVANPKRRTHHSICLNRLTDVNNWAVNTHTTMDFTKRSVTNSTLPPGHMENGIEQRPRRKNIPSRRNSVPAGRIDAPLESRCPT